MNLVELVKKRRSVYDIGKNYDGSVDDVISYITDLADYIPTAYNAQSSRLVVVTGDAHEKLWDIIYKDQEAVMGDKFTPIAERINRHKKGMGTILYFEDTAAVQKMPTTPVRQEGYKQNNSANTQYLMWLALTDLGLGAALIHDSIGYQEGFDRAIREAFDLPESWELIAEMPFGSIESEPAAKSKIGADKMVRHLTE